MHYNSDLHPSPDQEEQIKQNLNTHTHIKTILTYSVSFVFLLAVHGVGVYYIYLTIVHN